MGFKFLRHISRTVGLAFLIDLSDERYMDAFDTLSEELRSYAPELLDKPKVVIGTKIDDPEAAEHLENLRNARSDLSILGLSNITGEGLDGVKQAFIRLVGDAGNPQDDGFTTVVDNDAQYREEP